jgi:hypothetical protein
MVVTMADMTVSEAWLVETRIEPKRIFLRRTYNIL